MTYLVLQLSIITGLLWLTIRFFSGSSQAKRNYITVGFVICWLALINAVFSSHIINLTFDQPELSTATHAPTLADYSALDESSKTQALTQPSTIHLSQTDIRAPIKQAINWQIVIGLFWLIGIIIHTFKWFKQIQHIYNIKNQGQIIEGFDVNFKLYWSTKSEVPFLFAGKSSFIIIPTHMKPWPKANIKHIINHELCHYQRKDHWVLWFSVITKSVFWFHPLVHLLAKSQKQFIELACDQQLLASGVDPISYAETLLSCARNIETEQPVVAMANKPAQIKMRIQAVLYPNRKLARFKWLWLILVTPISMTACINLDQTDLISADQMIELISHDLQPLQDNQLNVGQAQLVAFYDGAINQQTFVSLELKNSKNQISWMKLGPLKKFNEYIHTWQFELKPDTYFTYRYKLQGAQADGVVDGVALGLLLTNPAGEVNSFQSKTAMPIGSKPNVVCAWPLGLLDEEFINALPQITTNNPDSVERIICGAQLMANGTYQLE